MSLKMDSTIAVHSESLWLIHLLPTWRCPVDLRLFQQAIILSEPQDEPVEIYRRQILLQ